MNGKPVDQVGFTKITKVMQGTSTVLAPGQAGTSVASCPAGTTVVGGGYKILGHVATATPPWMLREEDDDQNGWSVSFDNEQVGGANFWFVAIAYCAS